MSEEKELRRIEDNVYVSIKEHFKALLDGLEKRLVQADNNAKEALHVATEANERRLGLLNEFRGQSEDHAKKYAMKETTERLEKDLGVLTNKVGSLETRVLTLIGAGGFIVTLFQIGLYLFFHWKT